MPSFSTAWRMAAKTLALLLLKRVAETSPMTTTS